ncbi:triacylglycerol lipase 3 [Coprinellus micaceus]|uniref:Carboxylic ester hydrolase n=1 Tax=Coprinellus micaceus TaxID=71717 RepID=A0A4Y7TGS9_COPMI|nr:triacylglycerol lipase 3 [Coprinellus micaceus]
MLNPLLFSLACLVIVAHALPEVKLGRTTISGRAVSGEVDFFGGIPFAEPPIGQFRLRKPVLKTRLATPSFNASAYGKSCIQPMADPTTLSEDCLTISIFRPAGLSSKDKLPVLFWTYGGAFVIGSSNMYDGANLVTRSVARGTPIIYVNFNYRLGPLGYPLGQEAHDKRALNLGLHDQTAALEWVQANIHLFGGDKTKITIFGESAGAMMTGVQFLNPQLGKLARGAIFESGQANGPATFPAARNEPFWQRFVGNVASCAGLATSGKTFDCLKDAPTEEITAAVLSTVTFADLVWVPTVDTGKGSIYPDYPSRLFAKGRFAKLPFIAGNNRDEGTFFAAAQEMKDADFKTLLVGQHLPPTVSQKVLEEVADKLLELYPDDPTVGSPFGTGGELFGLPSSFKRSAALMGDLTFVAARRQWNQVGAQFGVKSYGYHFAHAQSPASQMGVPHASEIPFVYGQIPPADSAGQSLSSIMMDYWISFTVSLTPNDGKGLERPNWPRYTERDQVVLQLEGRNTTAVKDDFRKEQLAFLAKNAFVLRR